MRSLRLKTVPSVFSGGLALSPEEHSNKIQESLTKAGFLDGEVVFIIDQKTFESINGPMISSTSAELDQLRRDYASLERKHEDYVKEHK